MQPYLEPYIEKYVMNMTNRMRPVHPGEILVEELREFGMSANAFGQGRWGCLPTASLQSSMVAGAVTADTALRLSRYLGTSPEFWLNLQKTFELRTAQISSEMLIMTMIQPRQENPLPAASSD